MIYVRDKRKRKDYVEIYMSTYEEVYDMNNTIDKTALINSLSKNKIFACTVTKDDERVFEYFKNKKIEGKHQKIYSCTKTVLSLLIGIAFNKGYLHNLHEPIESYFTKELALQHDIRKKEITLYHLLTMTPGFHFPEWEEWGGSAPFTNGDNIQFVLDRELIYAPGEHMSYNSGCSYLLTAILQQVTNQSALDFANEQLFQPLGITDFQWHKDNKGIYNGSDGLMLTIPDMEKLCKLMLQKGKWKNKQIVSESWIKQAISPHYSTYKHIGEYGLHWWSARIDPELEDDSDFNRFHFGLGYGGQYMIVVPKFNLSVTFISVLYDKPLLPFRIFQSEILSAFTNNKENQL